MNGYPLCKNLVLHLKIADYQYFELIFPPKLIKSSTSSKWTEIESKAFQRWLHITLMSTSGHLSLLHVQHFLGHDVPFYRVWHRERSIF
jgi:hypothetical protein